jgi:phosphorylcholine metabolism protein LicD
MPVLKVRFNHRFEEKKYYYKVQGHSFQHFKFVKKKKKNHSTYVQKKELHLCNMNHFSKIWYSYFICPFLTLSH